MNNEMTIEQENKHLWDLMYLYQHELNEKDRKIKRLEGGIEVILDCPTVIKESVRASILRELNRRYNVN